MQFYKTEINELAIMSYFFLLKTYETVLLLRMSTSMQQAVGPNAV